MLNNVLMRYFSVAFLLVSVHAFAEGNQSMALRVVRTTGMADAARGQMRNLMRDAQQKNPDISRSTWDKVARQIESPKLDQEMAHLWAQTYTISELRQIQTFISTPAGRKFFKNNQTLMPRLAACAALESLHAFDILQKERPDRFPPDPKKDAQVKQLFEVLQRGTVAGVRK